MIEITEIPLHECWSPGASLWVTTLDSRNLWLPILDYRLNFQISLLKRRTESELKKGPLLVIPHGMLPTELVVLIASWEQITQLKKIYYPYKTTLVRLFNPSSDLVLSDDLKAQFVFESVTQRAPSL
jgi:hypothetical protein